MNLNYFPARGNPSGVFDLLDQLRRMTNHPSLSQLAISENAIGRFVG
jgi:hypothetical protein